MTRSKPASPVAARRWRHATAEEIESFERENPQSDELQTIALRLKSRSLVAQSVVDAPSGNVSHLTQ